MKDYYEKVSEKILELLEEGVVAWQKPWKVVPMQNPVTGTIYSGRNKLLLNASDYTSSYWLTFNEIKGLKGHVKKDEKSWPIVWYTWINGDSESSLSDEHNNKSYPLLRGYNVFNLGQTEGLNFPDPEIQIVKFNPIDKAQQLCDNYQAEVRHEGRQAYYSPTKHFINLPIREHFETETDYYLTRFHEMIHHTSKDLGRKISTIFGTKNYAFEELIAQIGASYLAEYSGLDASHFEDTASYVGSWIGREEWSSILSGDSSMFIRATTQAQRATNFILGSI